MVSPGMMHKKRKRKRKRTLLFLLLATIDFQFVVFPKNLALVGGSHSLA